MPQLLTMTAIVVEMRDRGRRVEMGSWIEVRWGRKGGGPSAVADATRRWRTSRAWMYLGNEADAVNGERNEGVAGVWWGEIEIERATADRETLSFGSYAFGAGWVAPASPGPNLLTHPSGPNPSPARPITRHASRQSNGGQVGLVVCSLQWPPDRVVVACEVPLESGPSCSPPPFATVGIFWP
jgi:hypothetical protein